MNPHEQLARMRKALRIISIVPTPPTRDSIERATAWLDPRKEVARDDAVRASARRRNAVLVHHEQAN